MWRCGSSPPALDNNTVGVFLRACGYHCSSANQSKAAESALRMICSVSPPQGALEAMRQLGWEEGSEDGEAVLLLPRGKTITMAQVLCPYLQQGIIPSEGRLMNPCRPPWGPCLGASTTRRTHPVAVLNPTAAAPCPAPPPCATITGAPGAGGPGARQEGGQGDEPQPERQQLQELLVGARPAARADGGGPTGAVRGEWPEGAEVWCCVFVTIGCHGAVEMEAYRLERCVRGGL